MAKWGVCWFILIYYILLTKTLPYYGHRISKRLAEDLLQNNYSRIESAEQGNICTKFH